MISLTMVNLFGKFNETSPISLMLTRTGYARLRRRRT